jgi:signal transduction histidine kinase
VTTRPLAAVSSGAAAAPLVLAALFWITVHPGHPAVATLATLAALSLAGRVAVAMGGRNGWLGALAPALDVAVGAAATVASARLTGGLLSPMVALLALEQVIARRLHGPPAARFAATVASLGLAGLAVLAPSDLAPAALVAAVAWPAAFLVATELAAPEPAPAPAASEPAGPAREKRRGASGNEPRDLKAEILHDLRSPLSVLHVYADLIAEKARKGEPPVDEHLRNLSAEIELMELMVDGAAGSPFAPKTGTVELARLLEDLTARYREAHGDKLTVAFEAETRPLWVIADPVGLQRALRNALENAVHYTPPGGTVRVRVGADEAHAHVVVADDGIGMSREDRARAFEPAYRGTGARALRPSGRGLGLGLSRELVESMGGSLSLWSEEDRGTEVRVLLPRVEVRR